MHDSRHCYDHVHPCPSCYEHVPCTMPQCTTDLVEDEVRGGFAFCGECEKQRPRCDCGRPAVCAGPDGEGGGVVVSCDECCGHGAIGEGTCEPLDGIP